MHAVPDYEHLLTIVDDIDAIEVYNPRVAIGSFNEEAERFARQVPDLGAARAPTRHVAPGPGLGARSGCATSTGPRSSSSRCARPRSSRKPGTLLYVQALKFLETKATPAGAARRAGEDAARAARDAQGADAAAGAAPGAVEPPDAMPATDDEIREKYLERAIRELNSLTRELQALRATARAAA